MAGQKTRCPSCGEVLQIPAPAVEPASAEAEVFKVLPVDAAGESEMIRKESPKPVDQAPSRVRRSKEPPADDERQPWLVFEEGWFGSINSGVIGGVLMMVIAVVWFVVGWLAGRIFLYPPFLFIIGFIAVMRGLFGGE